MIDPDSGFGGLDEDETDRKSRWLDLHPECVRCRDEVCLAAARGEDADEACICHGTIPGGVIVEGGVACGEVCREAWAAGAFTKN